MLQLAWRGKETKIDTSRVIIRAELEDYLSRFQDLKNKGNIKIQEGISKNFDQFFNIWDSYLDKLIKRKKHGFRKEVTTIGLSCIFPVSAYVSEILNSNVEVIVSASIALLGPIVGALYTLWDSTKQQELIKHEEWVKNTKPVINSYLDLYGGDPTPSPEEIAKYRKMWTQAVRLKPSESGGPK